MPSILFAHSVFSEYSHLWSYRNKLRFVSIASASVRARGSFRTRSRTLIPKLRRYVSKWKTVSRHNSCLLVSGAPNFLLRMKQPFLIGNFINHVKQHDHLQHQTTPNMILPSRLQIIRPNHDHTILGDPRKRRPHQVFCRVPRHRKHQPYLLAR